MYVFHFVLGQIIVLDYDPIIDDNEAMLTVYGIR